MKFKDSIIVKMSLGELEEAATEYINSHKGNFGGPDFDINDWDCIAFKITDNNFEILFERDK